MFNFPFEKIEFFILVFLRITGFVYGSPIFSHSTVNNFLKVALSFILALVIFQYVPLFELPSVNLFFYLMICVIEIVIGLIIGLFISFLFEIVIFGAYLIDYQIGFGFVNIVDPSRNMQISITSIFYSLLAFTLFIVLDFHHMLIESLLYSYKMFHVGNYYFNSDIFQVFNNSAAMIYNSGIKIGAPAILVVFSTEVIIGIIGRTVPKFQILIIGFPIKIAAGFIGISIALFFFQASFVRTANEVFRNLDLLIKTLGV